MKFSISSALRKSIVHLYFLLLIGPSAPKVLPCNIVWIRTTTGSELSFVFSSDGFTFHNQRNKSVNLHLSSSEIFTKKFKKYSKNFLTYKSGDVIIFDDLLGTGVRYYNGTRPIVLP